MQYEIDKICEREPRDLTIFGNYIFTEGGETIYMYMLTQILPKDAVVSEKA